MYLPGSLRDIRLYFKSDLRYSSFLKNKPKSKILVKQSYTIVMWIYHLLTAAGAEGIKKPDKQLDKKELRRSSLPNFFIYPTRNSKTTILKAPMAHKTFSQEQFMVRYYFISITFNLSCEPRTGGEVVSAGPILCDNSSAIGGINHSLYFSLFILRSVPYISTNMIFLKKYTLYYYATDETFFTYN